MADQSPARVLHARRTISALKRKALGHETRTRPLLAGLAASSRVLTRGNLIRAVALGAACLLLANCSNGPSVDRRLGVKPSPRVIADGQPVPKGGGRHQVGRPYTIGGATFAPTSDPDGYSGRGLASWYGPQFHGRLTSNGEIFDQGALSAAHPTLPLPSYARVTNLGNGRSVVVRVNDRGPFHAGRLIDVSRRTAEILAFRDVGMAQVRVDYVGPASLSGSDDRKLLATYSESGRAAPMPRDTLLAGIGRPSPAPVAAAPTPPPRPVPPAGEPKHAAVSLASYRTLQPLPIPAARPPAGGVVVLSPSDAGFVPVERPMPLVLHPNAAAATDVAPPLPGERPARLR